MQAVILRLRDLESEPKAGFTEQEKKCNDIVLRMEGSFNDLGPNCDRGIVTNAVDALRKILANRVLSRDMPYEKGVRQ
jgi:hypothetical protein